MLMQERVVFVRAEPFSPGGLVPPVSGSNAVRITVGRGARGGERGGGGGGGEERGRRGVAEEEP